MSRLPRRPSRVKPPLRGRAATRHYRGQYAPITASRPTVKPPSGVLPTIGTGIQPPDKGHDPPCPPSQDGQDVILPPPRKSLFQDLLEFYKGWVRIVRSMDQPWQWVLAFVIVLVSLLLLPRLL